MKVIVAEKCGFCPGVKNAISMAGKVLQERSTVYSLGSIIHNKDVVERMARDGLRTISSIDHAETGTVLIRSHGAAPSEIRKLHERGLEIVDATCVLVKRLQKIAESLESEGYKVIVIGDANHPEVRAVVGCVSDVLVVEDKSDLDELPRQGKLGIVCQTTKGPEHFGQMVGEIAKLGFGEIKVANTLCKETIKRQQSAVELCKKVDIMFVLGGLDSANTRRLVELCKKYNAETFHLQNWGECDTNILFGKKTAGVTAGASTPEWIIEDFVNNLKSFDENESNE